MGRTINSNNLRNLKAVLKVRSMLKLNVYILPLAINIQEVKLYHYAKYG